MNELIKIDLVEVKNDQLVTDSRKVAESFGKEHKDVLESIRGILAAENSATRFFYETTFDNRGKEYPMYFMNRDGFSLLVMGFNGKNALAWKLKYIAAFNTMEERWNSPEQVMSRALKMADNAIRSLTTKSKQQEQIINELKPKADYVDTILQNKGLVTITQIAKDYGMSGREMNAKLHDLKIQYKQSGQWLLYSNYQTFGYTHSETIDIIRSDGRPDVTMETKWTQKGRLFLYDLLKDNGIVPVIERKEAA